MRRRWSLALALLLALPAGAAETCGGGAPQTPLDLLDAVERALCRHPQTRQAWAEVMAQAAQVDAARAAYLPEATLSAGAFKGDSSRAVAGRPQLEARQDSDTRAAGVDLNWTLYDFGLRRANLARARHLLDAAGAARDQATQAVFAAAAQAYYDLLSARGALDAARETERAARESALAAAARHQAGAASLADKLQAQTAAAQASLKRVRADGEAKNAAGALAVAMGMDVTTPVILADGAAARPDTGFVESVAAMLERAREAHPAVRAARAQVAAAGEGVA
uniref:TolC family protein n=1 Tax=Janthinobacterium sp. TaxID=1871054 RepID=UPI00293D2628